MNGFHDLAPVHSSTQKIVVQKSSLFQGYQGRSQACLNAICVYAFIDLGDPEEREEIGLEGRFQDGNRVCQIALLQGEELQAWVETMLKGDGLNQIFPFDE